jgi:hypothetical protein
MQPSKSNSGQCSRNAFRHLVLPVFAGSDRLAWNNQRLPTDHYCIEMKGERAPAKEHREEWMNFGRLYRKEELIQENVDGKQIEGNGRGKKVIIPIPHYFLNSLHLFPSFTYSVRKMLMGNKLMVFWVLQ